jgi:hypothetical protein
VSFLRSTFALIHRFWRHAELQYAAMVEPSLLARRIDAVQPDNASPTPDVETTIAGQCDSAACDLLAHDAPRQAPPRRADRLLARL